MNPANPAVARGRVGAAALCFLVSLGLLAAPGSPAADHPRGEHLAGQLLVAAPAMGDPRFRETVIYMVGHDGGGAMGLIVNVPMGEVPFTTLLDRLKLDPEGVEGAATVYYGGPVDRGRGFFLHTTDLMLEGSVAVSGKIAMTTQPEMLRALAGSEGPERSMFALGYAGWGAGQLESELDRDDWFVIPADPGIVFADDPGATWRRAMARRRIDL